MSFFIDDDPAAAQPGSPAVSAELGANSTPAFSFEDVSWGVGSTQILTQLSESIAHGKVTALIGPNGSGKSSLLRILAGVQQPDAGTVKVAGTDWLAERPRTKAKTLAYVEQSASADRALTVFDVVLLGRTPHRSVLSSPRTLDVEVAVECLELVGMTALKDREFGTLSGGERQRVLIAKALAQQTDILVVDEPTNHLDVAAQLSTLALLRELADTGKTVLTALHDLNLAATFAHELIVMDRARFVTSGTPTEVLTEALIRKVYGVDSTVMTNPRTGSPLIVFG